ncbi:MAG: DUF423 domain-containing protein [Nannocystaceae bacterium]
MNGLRVAAIAGATAVGCGAFGAHGLRGRISEEMLGVYQTGALYHLVHAVALLALALYGRATGQDVRLPAALWWVGIGLFSGSLYIMAVTGLRAVGMVTPIGGLCMLAGWATLALWRSAPSTL